jgi:integrase/recombinase XerD
MQSRLSKQWASRLIYFIQQGVRRPALFPSLCNSVDLLCWLGMTIKEAYNPFMAYGRGERNYARETLTKRKDCFNAWILPILGDIEIDSLTRMDVVQLRNAMVDRQLGGHRQYSVIAALKVFCKFCRQVLKLNCLDPDREIQLPQRPQPFVHYLTNEEVERLRNALEIHTFTGLRMRTLVEVLLTTGLRISEALSLDRGPFEMGEVEIPIIGKGGKPRTIYFPDATIGWIKKFLRFRADDCPAVFVTTGIPRRWDRNDQSKYFKALKWRAGIDKPLTPHILRHTYCTNLRDNGTDITLIKELAGHQDIQTTAKYYLGVSKQALRDAVRKNLNYSVPREAPSAPSQAAA